MPDAYVPMTVNGQTRLVSIPVDDRAREMARQAEEATRRVEVAKRRLYYGGEQYAAENAVIAQTLHLDPLTDRVPEHKRKHAYSTQIAESVDFLADRIGEGFAVEASAQQVTDVIEAMVTATDLIAAESEDGEQEFVTDDVLREALVAGDCPVEVKWDPIEARPFLEFWEAEKVEFVRTSSRVLQKVIRTEVVWIVDPLGQERQVRERHEYEMRLNPAFVMEACRRVWWDDETEDKDVKDVEWLGVGRLPWALLRADSKSLRASRGESLVSVQAMETADRYNAVEQVGWLIARYNSHANVAVIGDGASLKMESDGRISKDVADVLTFPGGTALQVLTLPTDPQMIEHQRRVLSDALHAAFGLVRIEPDTVNGLGGISGYALEILNQKTEGTFRRIRRHWRKDWVSLLNLVLDVTAWKGEAALGLVDLASGAVLPFADDLTAPVALGEDAVLLTQWWLIDPQAVFPDRKIEIRLGTGYIVDEVKIREDFTANLISRKEALRQRGLGPDEIETIEDEIADAEPDPPETAEFGALPPGVVQPVVKVPATTGAGSTVAGDTDRK